MPSTYGASKAKLRYLSKKGMHVKQKLPTRGALPLETISTPQRWTCVRGRKLVSINLCLSILLEVVNTYVAFCDQASTPQWWDRCSIWHANPLITGAPSTVFLSASSSDCYLPQQELRVVDSPILQSFLFSSLLIILWHFDARALGFLLVTTWKSGTTGYLFWQ